MLMDFHQQNIATPFITMSHIYLLHYVNTERGCQNIIMLRAPTKLEPTVLKRVKMLKYNELTIHVILYYKTTPCTLKNILFKLYGMSQNNTNHS